MKALLNSRNIVIAVSENIMSVENGVIVDDSMYVESGLKIVEVTEVVEPMKHQIVDDIVLINPEWEMIEERKKQTPEYKITLLEQENAELKEKQALMQQALDELILGGTV